MKIFVLTMAILAGVVAPITFANARPQWGVCPYTDAMLCR